MVSSVLIAVRTSIRRGQLSLRRHEMNLCQRGFRRSKSTLVKHRWASERKRNPRFLAVQYFDMCYMPVFKEKWPSIRLGLLSDPKYGAAINTLAADDTVLKGLLELGTFELFDQIKDLRSTGESFLLKSQSTEMDVQPIELPSAMGELSRDESALGEFIRPTEFITKGVRPNAAIEMRSPNFAPAISQDCVIPYDVQYPENLKIMLFPPGDISIFPPSCAMADGSLAYYLMDVASVLPIIALDLRLGDSVLDMCAAPGGKTLLILGTLLPGSITCNDLSLRRFNRLRRTLNFYVPADCELRRRIVLKREDASDDQWDELEKYDKVLVDAPCTNDRLCSDDDLNLFRRSRTEERLKLPHVQIALIQNGIRSLKLGGSLVYSTCTLSPVQNDAVIEEVLRQNSEGPKVAICDLSSVAWPLQRSGIFHFHPCRYGLQVVPSVLSNFGPMYVCKLQKMA
uniref:NOL1/NOP2/Sun domain family member 4 n=1 Tax=Trichuris muris TaxID=70415 RepID=A0A5S6QEX3_TRIMR